VITVTHTTDGGKTDEFQTCQDAATHLLKLLTLDELRQFELFVMRQIKREVAATTTTIAKVTDK
jgi:hypothetical protein